MKNWTPPKIKVELFTANESIAACNGLITSFDLNRYYWDWLEDGHDGYYYIVDNGPGDGVYQSPYYGYESMTNLSNDSWHVSSEAPEGWYTSINFYSSYNNRTRRYTTSAGVFNVYVFSTDYEKRAYIYSTDITPGFTPTPGHNMS